MSGISIDSFHLDFSQIDASEILSTSAISIRKTASIRIYRCQGEHCCCIDTSANNEKTKTTESTKMLAILVPHSFTTGIINVAEDHKLNNYVDSLQKLQDAEVELRKSIHPCLVEEDNDPDGRAKRSGAPARYQHLAAGRDEEAPQLPQELHEFVGAHVGVGVDEDLRWRPEGDQVLVHPAHSRVLDARVELAVRKSPRTAFSKTIVRFLDDRSFS